MIKSLNLKNGFIFIVGTMLAVFCRCIDLPTDPKSVTNTKFEIVFKSPTLSVLDASSFTDTLGTRVRIGIASNLTMHIDSASLALVSAESAVDTVAAFYDFTAMQTADTAWFYYTLRDTGKITVCGRVYVHDLRILSDTVTLTVFARVNHAPRMLVSGKTTVEVDEPCSLSFGASDPDAGQKMQYSIDDKPDSAHFDTIFNFFKWTPGITDTGVHSFVFRVMDNGFPPMADSLKYDLTVTPGVGNRAPVWLHDTIGENIQPGVLFSKTLSDACSDPDDDPLQFILLGGTPAHDTIIAATYIFTPSAQDTGSVYPMIVVTDPSGAADTLVLHLAVTTLDFRRPTLKLISPADSAVVSSNSVPVKVTCTDASGIKWVKCSLGADTFVIASAGNDSIYTAMVSGLKPGIFNTIVIIAADASPGRNRDTLLLRLKYDKDATPPVISRLDPQKDSVSISADEYTIKVRCTDASGIASLSCTLGTTNFTAANGGDSVWSVNVTGLQQNLYNRITFIATDSSLKANKDTLSLFINYDPTLDDNVTPAITCLTGLPPDMIVADSVISITDSIYDASGVDSVYWTLNGKNRRMLSAVLTTATGGKYLLTDTLRRYHLDTIDVYAVDKSTARNRGTQRIVLNFNVPPVARDTSVSTVMNTAKTIALTAVSKDSDALTWSSLGDPVHGTAGITGTTATYTPTSDWAGVDSFFVKVFDGVWSDTAKVRVTTTDNRIAPKNVVIVVVPASDTVVIGQPLSMSVTMNSDVTPAPTYQWFKNNVPIGTAATYSVAAAALTDSGSYKVTVTNGAGSFTSQTVKVYVLVKPSALSYLVNPAVYWTNSAITPNTVSVTGIVNSYSISPALSSGLTLNAQTGAITGTPTVARAAQNYTITATNSAGPTTATLSITVNGPPTAAPNIVSPKSDSNGVVAGTLLSWSTVASATGYSLQVADNAGFSGPVVDYTGLTANVRDVTLSNSKRYYWRVCASNQGGQGPWKADSFITVIKWTSMGQSSVFVHSIAGGGNGNLYLGTDGGVFRTTNNGSSWTAANSGLVELSEYADTSIYTICSNGSNVFVRNGRNELFGSTNYGNNWTIVGPFSNDIALSGANVYSITQTTITASYNNGTTWINPQCTGLSGMISRIAANGNDVYTTVIMHGDIGLYRSQDKGNTWSLFGLSDNAASTIATIENTVYAATYSNGIYVNDGTVWTVSPSSPTTASDISGSGTKVVSVSDAGAFFSANSGNSWVPTDNLPGVAGWCVCVYNGYIFVGTEANGVFRSPLP